MFQLIKIYARICSILSYLVTGNIIKGLEHVGRSFSAKQVYGLSVQREGVTGCKHLYRCIYWISHGSCVPEDSVVNINILFYIKLCREQRFACVICIIRVYKEYSFYMLIYVLARQVIFVLVLYVRLCI